MKTFDEGCAELERLVGHGKLVGKLEVDQPYAAPQHQGYWLTGPLAGHVIVNHPRGGGSHFLDKPLYLRAGEYMHNLADAVLSGFLVQAMAENMEDLAEQVFELAPRDEDILRNSSHPLVFDDQRVAYDRAPIFPRQSAEEIAARARARREQK